MFQKYKDRLDKVGLTEYEILDIIKQDTYYLGIIQCKNCKNIEEVDINSKIRYKSHCTCIKTNTCTYCGEKFAPKKANSRSRKVCYKCNPYIANENPNEYKRQMRELNWEKLQKELNLNGCVICGFNKFKSALDFHHLDPNLKDITPSQILHLDFDKVLNEVSKCILVCANCHRGIHSNDIKL